jgi:hypothetical protein
VSKTYGDGRGGACGLCSPCHRHIHTVLDNKKLEHEYNTLEALKAHPGVGRFVEWISRKPHDTTGAKNTRRDVG